MPNIFKVHQYCNTTKHGDDVLHSFSPSNDTQVVISCDGVSTCTSGRIAAAIAIKSVSEQLKNLTTHNIVDRCEQSIKNAAQVLVLFSENINNNTRIEIQSIKKSILEQEREWQANWCILEQDIKTRQEKVDSIIDDINNIKEANQLIGKTTQCLKNIKNQKLFSIPIAIPIISNMVNYSMEMIITFFLLVGAFFAMLLNRFWGDQNTSNEDTDTTKSGSLQGKQIKQDYDKLNQEIAKLTHKKHALDSNLESLRLVTQNLQKTLLGKYQAVNIPEAIGNVIKKSTSFGDVAKKITDLINEYPADEEYKQLTDNVLNEVYMALYNNTPVNFRSTLSLNIVVITDGVGYYHSFTLGDPQIYIPNADMQVSKIDGGRGLQSYIDSEKGIVGDIKYILNRLNSEKTICIGSDGANLAYCSEGGFPYVVLCKEVKKGTENPAENVAKNWYQYLNKKNAITDDFSLAIVLIS